jgi:hypothetical protein
MCAEVLQSASFNTRSGQLRAIDIAVMPPSEIPQT